MSSISQFLLQKADALTSGDIEALATGFDTPTSFYIGENLIYIPDRGRLQDILGQFRANLVAQGYAGTEFVDVSEKIIGPDSVQVTVDWIDYGPDRRVLEKRRTCFYCTRRGEGDWTVKLVNMHDAPAPALLAGLVLH
jgi:hypothetical protein